MNRQSRLDAGYRKLGTGALGLQKLGNPTLPQIYQKKKKVGSHPPPLNNIPILRARLLNVVENHGDIFRTAISLNTAQG